MNATPTSRLPQPSVNGANGHAKDNGHAQASTPANAVELLDSRICHHLANGRYIVALLSDEPTTCPRTGAVIGRTLVYFDHSFTPLHAKAVCDSANEKEVLPPGCRYVVVAPKR